MKAAPTVLLLLVATGCSALPELPVSSVGAGGNEATIELEIHERVNDYRRGEQDGGLALDPVLSRIAREHSEAMAAGIRTFGHDGFDGRASEARSALGVAQMSENVATNNFPPPLVAREVVEGWIASPGHLRNLRGAYELTGVGVARGPTGDFFVTQVYAAR